MKHETFAAHTFTDDHFPFDIKMYSRFKHGSIMDAYTMANDMFNRYLPVLDNIIEDNCKEFIIFPSPYHFIQSACSLIKDRFLVLLNRHLVDSGCPPATEAQIHRRLTYHTDYGVMQADERERLINGDKFYIDREYIKDKFCLFLDDVRITGSHERVVEKLLPLELDYQVLYFARYEGSDPTIESRINTAQVSNIFTLMPLFLSLNFSFNVRNVRMLLSLDEDYFKAYITSMLSSVSQMYKPQVARNRIEQFYDLCIGNHFHEQVQYKINIEFLQTFI